MLQLGEDQKGDWPLCTKLSGAFKMGGSSLGFQATLSHKTTKHHFFIPLRMCLLDCVIRSEVNKAYNLFLAGALIEQPMGIILS